MSFVLTAGDNGFYTRKAQIFGRPHRQRAFRPDGQDWTLNGSPLRDVSVPATADWNTPADADINVFLTAGINRIAFNASTDDDGGALVHRLHRSDAGRRRA